MANRPYGGRQGGKEVSPLSRRRGTLIPSVPLSLRAIKGEGKQKTEASACALAQALASSLVLGGGGNNVSSEGRGGLMERRYRFLAGPRNGIGGGLLGSRRLFGRDGFLPPQE